MGKAEQQIIDEIKERAKKGFEKYSCTTDRTDLTLLDWLEHSKQENMDLLIYNQVLQDRLYKLKEMTEFQKYLEENKRSHLGIQDTILRNKQLIFEEAMKLMLGDGIIEYINQL